MTADPKSTDYLVFVCQGARYGLRSEQVSEIVRLPELTWSEDAPDCVAGVMNLRGRVIPVVDTEQRLGYAARMYAVSDFVIVIEQGTGNTGVIVDQIHEVREIDTNVIEDTPDYGDAHDLARDLFEGIATLSDGLITLLRPDRLLIETDDQDEAEAQPTRSPDREFCPHVTDEEREILQQRARVLSVTDDGQDENERLSIAVARVGKEYLGFPLDQVSQFSDIGSVTVVPGSHSDIMGITNVRGERTVLLALGRVLGSEAEAGGTRVAVVESEGESVGFVVDEILDVVTFHSDEIRPVGAGSQETRYLTGSIQWEDKLLGLINFDAILTKYVV
jgi:purine-binding chemotaxis protein CheW